MWEIDNFGNAINPETENEIYQIVGGECPRFCAS